MEGSGPVILEIGIVLSIAVAAGWLMRRLGLPAVIGYLAVGLVVSPFTPGYVADRHELHVLADIGVVLLLFEVGIEIDPLQLSRGRKAFLWVVPLHTILVTGVAALATIVFGLGWQGGLLIGVSVALSSSVVIVNITRSARRTTTEATDKALLGWSVLQDVTGVTLAAVIVAVIGVRGRPPWLAILGMLGFAALDVNDVHNIRVRRNAHGVFVTYHCRVNGEQSVETIHEAVDDLESRLRKKLPQIRRVVAHAEPLTAAPH